nr:PREDICTED: A disintegrin and metalloproteinase with thrombospondin motifs 17-like [Equus przewalskii]
MCDGALLPPLVLPLLLLLFWGLDPGTGSAPSPTAPSSPAPLAATFLLPSAASWRPLPARTARLRRQTADSAWGRERALLLHLPAFGRDLYLQLRRDLRFLSRGFEVEEAGVAERRGRPAELCFYSGRVLGHPGSLVSLSACGAAGGLVGLIQLGQEQVLIQPVNNSQSSLSGQEHLIRRKWSLTPSPSTDTQVPGRLCKVLTEKKPRRGRPSRDWRERRNAIQLTNEHTVETLVVADADMVQYHGAEAAQRFILTVMNMVEHIGWVEKLATHSPVEHQSWGAEQRMRSWQRVDTDWEEVNPKERAAHAKTLEVPDPLAEGKPGANHIELDLNFPDEADLIRAVPL